MEKEKLRIIEKIINVSEDNVSPFAENYINALYEIIVNEDFDYIPNLFHNMEDFFEFVEKWKPNKCSTGEN